MGFLHKLWDETLAGPAPEIGLGKLRKYDSFHGSTASHSPPAADHEDIAVTRSITILRTNPNTFRNLSVDPGSPSGSSTPTTPFGMATPRSPFSPGTPRGEFKKYTRKRSTAEIGL